MKKIIIALFLCMFTLLSNSFVYAQEATTFSSNNDTKVGVGFDEVEILDSSTSKLKPKVDVYQPPTKATVSTMLPQTNELLQTLMTLLVGIALLLIVLGMKLYKITYSNKNNVYYL